MRNDMCVKVEPLIIYFKWFMMFLFLFSSQVVSQVIFPVKKSYKFPMSIITIKHSLFSRATYYMTPGLKLYAKRCHLNVAGTSYFLYNT